MATSSAITKTAFFIVMLYLIDLVTRNIAGASRRSVNRGVVGPAPDRLVPATHGAKVARETRVVAVGIECAQVAMGRVSRAGDARAGEIARHVAAVYLAVPASANVSPSAGKVAKACFTLSFT